MACAARKVVVLGPAGAGKSLLAQRLVQVAAGALAEPCEPPRGPGTRVWTLQLPGPTSLPPGAAQPATDPGRDPAAASHPAAPAGTTIRLWDGPGHTLLDSLNQGLLAGASAWLLVADGTDAGSIDSLPLLHASASACMGRAAPTLVLRTKCDLAGFDASEAGHPLRRLGAVHAVSARTDQGLLAVLDALARLLD